VCLAHGATHGELSSAVDINNASLAELAAAIGEQSIAASVFLATVRAGPGRLSFLSISLCASVFYGAFVWARRALNCQKRRFPARQENGHIRESADCRLHVEAFKHVHAVRLLEAGIRFVVGRVYPPYGCKTGFPHKNPMGVKNNPVLHPYGGYASLLGNNFWTRIPPER
jgi:hypothetical protein